MVEGRILVNFGPSIHRREVVGSGQMRLDHGEAAYRQGRVARFIEPILQHGEIFLTAGFKDLTGQAMRNLRQEREDLISPPAV
jgi:hypothetical protein